jgi:hypothetical protein
MLLDSSVGTMFGGGKRPREATTLAEPSMMALGPVDYVDVALGHDSELRITVPPDEVNARIRVLPPNIETEVQDAEVLGAPLAIGFTYRLRSGTSFPVWSWQGCVLRLTGSDKWRESCVYRAPSSHYKAVVEYHAHVHRDRESAKTNAVAQMNRAKGEPTETEIAATVGPRVLICGGSSAGRHSVMRALANYAVRTPAGWAPTVVDLDPNHQTFGPTGTIGIAAWEYAATLDEDVAHMMSALYWVGSSSPLASSSADMEPSSASFPTSAVYTEAVANVIRTATKRLANQPLGSIVRWSGSIMMAPAFPDPIEGARVIAGMVNSSVATHLLVVGDPDLHAALLHRFDSTLSPAMPRDAGVYATSQGTPFAIDFLSASTGAVDAALPAIEAPWRNQRLSLFFNGAEGVIPMVLTTVTLNFANVDVVRWVDVDGKAIPQLAAEAKYAVLAEKRVGALYRAKDASQFGPMLFPCHIYSVEGNTISIRISGVFSADKGERYTLVVGSVVWLD